MKSHEIMRAVLKPYGYKNIASELKLSCSIVEKWARPNQDGRSAELSPLDRLVALTEMTGDQRLVQWQCTEADGFFVPNVAVPRAGKDSAGEVDLTQAEHALQKQIGELELALMEALEEPAASPGAERLRSRWEALKTTGERLVRALERGEFRKSLLAWLVKFYPVWDALTRFEGGGVAGQRPVFGWISHCSQETRPTHFLNCKARCGCCEIIKVFQQWPASWFNPSNDLTKGIIYVIRSQMSVQPRGHRARHH